MNIRFALSTIAAALLSLALIAPASAAVGHNTDLAAPAIAPAGPGGQGNGKPEDTGKPQDPGRPDTPGTQNNGTGKPADAGVRSMPELPPNASPKAHAAVAAAYERFATIKSLIAEIRALEPGADRNAAMNELFAGFGDLMHSVSDAVHEADPKADTGDGATLTSDNEDTGDPLALSDNSGENQDQGEVTTTDGQDKSNADDDHEDKQDEQSKTEESD